MFIVNPQYFYLNANRCLCMFKNREKFQCEGQECRIQRANPISALCLFILTVCALHNTQHKSHRHKQRPDASISGNDDVILTDNAVMSVFTFAVRCDKLQKSMQCAKRIRTTLTAVAIRREVEKKTNWYFLFIIQWKLRHRARIIFSLKQFHDITHRSTTNK